MSDTEFVWYGKARGHEGEWNWPGSWVGGVLPGILDIPVFTENDAPVTGNLDQRDILYRNVIFNDDFSGDIASGSGKLQLRVDKHIINKGRGNTHLDLSARSPSKVKIRTSEVSNSTYLDSGTNLDDVQNYKILDAVSGNYTITLQDEFGESKTTANILWNASIADIQTAIDTAIGGIAGRIVVSGTAQTDTILTFSGTNFTYRWQPIHSITDVDLLTGNGDVTITSTHTTEGHAKLNDLTIEKGLVKWQLGTVSTIYMELIDSLETDANLTLEKGAGIIDLLRQVGGTFTQEGGTLSDHKMHEGSAKILNESIYTSLAQFGGEVDWRTIKTLTNGFIYNGHFTAANDPRKKIISHIECHGEATVDLDNGAGNIELTEGGVLKYGKHMPVISTGIYVGGEDVPV